MTPGISDFDESTRAGRIAILSRAQVQLIASGLQPFGHLPSEYLRIPEVGLFMSQGRTGGSGDRFNLGEILVTRCVIKTRIQDTTYAGVSYVLGDAQQHASLAAKADALLQCPETELHILNTVIRPTVARLRKGAHERAAQTQSTQVEFFTVARNSSVASTPDEPA